jgi:hypothetical protein
MPLAGFEPVIPSIERPYSYALERTVTMNGYKYDFYLSFFGATAPPPAVGHGLFNHEVSRYTQRRSTVGRTPLDE